MKISDLEIYSCVAHYLSFTEAAHKLNMTQPGVSRTIKNIEQQLGAELFDRSGTKIALTPGGEIFLQSSRAILQQYQSSVNQLNSYNQEVDGKIRLRCMSIIMSLLGKAFFPGFLSKYPGIQIEHQSLTDQKLIDHDYDGISICMEKPDGQQMIAHRIFSYQYNYYATKSYLAKYGWPSHPEELNQHNCLLGGRPWFYSGDNEKKPVPLSKQLISTSEQVVETLCKEGVGIARLPVFYVNHYLSDANLVPVFDHNPHLAANLFAVYKKQKVQQYRKKLLIKELTDFFDQVEKTQLRRMV